MTPSSTWPSGTAQGCSLQQSSATNKRNGARPFSKTTLHPKQTERREDIHFGLIVFVGKGLDPFLNMAKRNGARPFPTTIIRHATMDWREDIHLGLIPFVGKGLVPIHEHNQAERRKAVPYNNHPPQPNGTAQDRSLQQSSATPRRIGAEKSTFVEDFNFHQV